MRLTLATRCVVRDWWRPDRQDTVELVKTAAERRAFVRENTALEAVPLVPELRVYTGICGDPAVVRDRAVARRARLGRAVLERAVGRWARSGSLGARSSGERARAARARFRLRFWALRAGGGAGWRAGDRGRRRPAGRNRDANERRGERRDDRRALRGLGRTTAGLRRAARRRRLVRARALGSISPLVSAPRGHTRAHRRSG